MAVAMIALVLAVGFYPTPLPQLAQAAAEMSP